MGSEDFVLNIINSENVDAMDLNIIANTMASTDSLIRQIKQQCEENEKMKEKVNSLRTSAMQIKHLYEMELQKNQSKSSKDMEYTLRIRKLEEKCMIIQNEKLNSELLHRESVAELERKLEEMNDKYNNLCYDMANHCSVLKENNLFPMKYESKYKEMKNYLSSLNDIPMEVWAIINKTPKKKKKARKIKEEIHLDDTFDTFPSQIDVKTLKESNIIEKTTKDQETMTCFETFDVAVNTMPTTSKSISTNTKMFTTKSIGTSTNEKSVDMKVEISTKSIGTNTENVLPDEKSKGSEVKSIGTSTEEEKIGAISKSNAVKITSSIGVNTENAFEKAKVFCDKATMHTPISVTRSTCTSAFIKHVDVGVNFPEKIPKSIEEILKECVVDLQPPLSPIAEFKLLSHASSTQTDNQVERNSEICTQTEENVVKKKFATIGTVTTIKNIRKKVDYCKKLKSLFNGHHIQQELLKNIKKEEMSPAISMANLNSFNSFSNECTRVNPQLSSLWALLGDTIFTLMGTGKMLDTQSFTSLNEKIILIKNIIDESRENDEIEKRSPKKGIVDTEIVHNVSESESEMPNNVESVHEEIVPETNEEENETEASNSAMECESECVISEETNIVDLEEDAASTEITITNEATLTESAETDNGNDKEKKEEEVETSPEEIVENFDRIDSVGNIEPVIDKVQPVEEDDEIEPLIIDEQAGEEEEVGVTASKLVGPVQVATEMDSDSDCLKIVEEDTASSPPKLPKLNSSLQVNEAFTKGYVPVVSSSFSLLLSPIKLKETNTLVKDQFKIPQSPSRIKRKSPPVKRNEDNLKKVKLDNEWKNTLSEIKSLIEIPVVVDPLEDEKLLAPISVETDWGENVDYDSPLSPTEPADENPAPEPKIIPLDHVSWNPNSRFREHINTPINNVIAKYSTAKRGEVIQKLQKKSCINDDVVAAVRKMVHEYIITEWTVEKINFFCDQIVKFSDDPRVIAHAVLESVVAYDDFIVNMQFSPPAPALPETHQKLVLLVKKLSLYIPSLEHVLLVELDTRMFTLKTDVVTVKALILYTHFYVGISDCNRRKCSNMRIFLYKCLYYYKFKCLPMVYIVLKAYPRLLPKKNSTVYDNTDSIVSTIRTILMNINYSDKVGANDSLYNKIKLIMLLKDFYGYSHGSPTYEELIENLVQKIKANKLKNVSYGLILLAKRNGYNWAQENIIKPHLYPMLNQYLLEVNRNDEYDQRIITCIFSMSSILKTQSNPDMSEAMQIYTTLIHTTAKQAVQEAAVGGLIKLTRFGYAEIYERLCKWNPPYEISNKLMLMLKTFVHRKQATFWRMLGQQVI